ncbi:MAG: hypothetical protein NTX04_00665 [Verrucomicrobia bacterium]|nr:hypothetical protein [Verrucomicrobiota bacterium]
MILRRAADWGSSRGRPAVEKDRWYWRMAMRSPVVRSYSVSLAAFSGPRRDWSLALVSATLGEGGSLGLEGGVEVAFCRSARRSRTWVVSSGERFNSFPRSE